MIINYTIDPLRFYRDGSVFQVKYTTKERYQMPGLVKNKEYDTLMIGTSMSLNFQESEMNAAFGGKSLNAAMSAASTYEQRLLIDLAFNSNSDVKQVFWEMNPDSFSGDVKRVNDEHSEFPFYLYDQNVLTDFKYLASTFPLTEYKDMVLSYAKGNRDHTDAESLYKFSYPEHYLKLADFQKIGTSKNDKPADKDVNLETMLAHWNENVLPVLKENPDKEFTLYFTPYSVVYYTNMFNWSNEKFYDRLDLKRTIFKDIQDLPNVKLYDFQDEKSITHHVTKYYDPSHYEPVINSWMIQQIHDTPPIKTEEEYEKKIDALEKHVVEVSRDKIY
jgi:hypothetical protein